LRPLSLDHDPPICNFWCSWDYRREPLCLVLVKPQMRAWLGEGAALPCVGAGSTGGGDLRRPRHRLTALSLLSHTPHHSLTQSVNKPLSNIEVWEPSRGTRLGTAALG
jgi:hypothetical protein